MPKSNRQRRRGEDPTQRELQVFAAYCAYGDRAKAATAMGICSSTMRNHINSLYRKAGFTGQGNVLTMATRLGWLKVPDDLVPPDVPMLLDEHKTLDGVVLSLRDAITEYAVQHTDRLVKANERVIYREARKRALDRLNEELEEMRPPKLIGRVRRTA